MINCVKAEIDKTQQKSKCRLCGGRDETINHITREFNKLVQNELKTKHDWVGKVIYWESCKKFKFDHTNNWFQHCPLSALENMTYKLFWDFEIKTDHLMSPRGTRPNDNHKKERTCKIVDFAVLVYHWMKLKESEKRGKYLDLARELKKTMEHEGDDDTNFNCCTWNNPQIVAKWTGRLGKKRIRGNDSDYSIIKIGWEYREELWKLETCCLEDSCARPSADTSVRNSQKNIITIIIDVRK